MRPRRPKRGSAIVDQQPRRVSPRRGTDYAGSGTGHRIEEGDFTTDTAETGHGAAGIPVAAEVPTHHQDPSPAADRRTRVPKMWVPKKESPQERSPRAHDTAPGSTSTPCCNSPGQAGKSTPPTSAPGTTPPTTTPSPTWSAPTPPTSAPGTTPPTTTPSPAWSAPTGSGTGTQALDPSAKGTPTSDPPGSAPSTEPSSHRSDYSSSSSSWSSRPPSYGRSAPSSGTSKSCGNVSGDPREQAQEGYSSTDLWLDLLKFLNQFTRDSTTVPFYKAQVAAMKNEGNFKFEINFNHLMEHDMHMAMFLCNNAQNRMADLICPVICHFLFKEELSADKSVIDERLQVEISNMPKSIKFVAEFVREKGGWVKDELLARRYKVISAADVGMMVVHRGAAEMFRAHEMGLSWDGKLDINDFVVINDDEIRIRKRPAPGGPASKAKDAQRIGSIFIPKFVLNGQMALYFRILKEDLASVTEEDVVQEWFVLYILAHPALRPAIARYHLVIGIDKTSRKFGVPGSKLEPFLEAQPSWEPNWRSRIPVGSKRNVFCKIYHHNFTATKAFPHPFDQTNGGLLSFSRNFYQHADVYLNICDISDVEKIYAMRFEEAVPMMLKTLLRDSKMNNNAPLNVFWKAYRDTRVGGDSCSDLGGKIGVYMLFW